MTKDKVMPDNDDFDFANAKKVPEEEEEEKDVLAKLKGKLGGKTKEIKKLKKQIATSGSLTPVMIKEARELSKTPTGLDIEKFMLKHKLITFDIEQVLNAPLKKDGSFA